MLNISTLDKYDPKGMYKIYDNWPKIALDSYESDLEIARFKKIDHIVFAGMGGSGALGDIFSAILSKTKLHVVITKGYHLPNTVDSRTLVVAISISGNTVETLSVLDSARKTNANLIAFSSGGKIEKYCKKHKIEYRKIPQFHSPRASFTAFLYSILRVLGPALPIKRSKVLESIRELEKLKKKISSENLSRTNPSLELAKWIKDIPMIYYPFGLQAAATRFKNSLQENAKIHTMAEDVVEASHNGVVSWEKRSLVKPILLEGKDDFIKTKERWLILKRYFGENNIDFREIKSTSGNILTKIIHLIYLLDYCSIYLAVLTKVDPSPIPAINYIKKYTA
ncbi:MAG: SIS domain-containing protein [Candidatus Nitrosotenuis sp.]